MYTDDDWKKSQHVDSFATTELVFPQASVIGLRLYDSNQEEMKSGHKSTPYQFRISADRARKLAEMLTAAADDLDGIGQQCQ